MSRPKETHFFSAHYTEGPDRYRRFFAHHRNETAVIECTPSYLALPFVPARIAQLVPDVTLVAVLREPVQQVYSAWWKIYSMGADRRSFATAVEQELRDGTLDDAEAEARWLALLAATEGARPITQSLYLDSGYYLDSLARYDRLFAPGQLHVLLHEDLARDAIAFTRSFASIVGVDVTRAPSPQPPRVNEGSGRLTAAVRRATRRAPEPVVRQAVRVARRLDRSGIPPLDPGLRRMLTAHFAERNRGLSQRIGRDVSAWEGAALEPSG